MADEPALRGRAAEADEDDALAEEGTGGAGETGDGPAPTGARERPASERKKVKAGVSRRSKLAPEDAEPSPEGALCAAAAFEATAAKPVGAGWKR